MGMRPFTLSRATSEHAQVIWDLGDDARRWLRGKDTDQWSIPWRGPQMRSQRIQRDLDADRTWIAWDGDLGVATITVDIDVPLAAPDTPVWPAHALDEKAVY